MAEKKEEYALVYRFGICHEDYHYVVNLMEYVNSTPDAGVVLVAFSSSLAVEEYLEKNYLDGLLIGQEINLQESFYHEHGGLAIVFLSEDRNANENSIFKYQSAEKIIEDILDRLNVSLGGLPEGTKLFCSVYSPEARCGKTSLAKALGVKNRGALYFCFEDFGARDSIGEEILYHIKVKGNRLLELIDRVPYNEYGFKEIKGILTYMDIRQLCQDNMEWLKEQLMQGTNCDRVIFDIGVGALSDLNMLKVMDRIYVPTLGEDSVRLQAFRELLRCREYMELNSRIKYVTVPMCHYASEDMQEFVNKGEL